MADNKDGIKRITDPQKFGEAASQLDWGQEATLADPLGKVTPVVAAALNGATGVVPDESGDGSISQIASNKPRWEAGVERYCDAMSAEIRNQRAAAKSDGGNEGWDLKPGVNYIE